MDMLMMWAALLFYISANYYWTPFCLLHTFPKKKFGSIQLNWVTMELQYNIPYLYLLILVTVNSAERKIGICLLSTLSITDNKRVLHSWILVGVYKITMRRRRRQRWTSSHAIVLRWSSNWSTAEMQTKNNSIRCWSQVVEVTTDDFYSTVHVQ